MFFINILICDDDKRYADLIKANVESFFRDKMRKISVDSYTTEAEIASLNKSYDMAFLDIEMGNIKGTDVAEKLKAINPHIIICFITAYNQYLDDAMDLNAFRFITKPLDITRLQKCLEKAYKLLDSTMIELMLKNNDCTRKIASNDIVYIEIKGRGTEIVTIKDTYVSNNRMDFWEKHLTASFFYKVHKSYMINMKCITEYHRDHIILNGKYNIPISSRKQSDFKHYFLSFIAGV